MEWHYVITGPPDTPYEGGQYHGTLTFPSEYPFKPPAIRMHTPTGRFQPDMRLCLSISDYHPKSWNPAWSVNTILTGLVSFMVSDEITAGSITTDIKTKEKFNKQSRLYNATRNKAFKEQFPELVKENIQWAKEKLNITNLDSATLSSAQGSTTNNNNNNNNTNNANNVLIKNIEPQQQGRRNLVNVNLDNANNKAFDNKTKEEETSSNNNNNNKKKNSKIGMSNIQKVVCVAVIFVSWIVASKMVSS